MAAPPQVIGPHVVLGEGERDRSFLDYLCQNRQIAGLTLGYVGGNGGFRKYLDGMFAGQRFSECNSILLVSDNDESAADSFKEIKDQLNAIGFPSPSHPLEIAKKHDYPSIGILMLPHPASANDTRGCLETLLIQAMTSAHPMQAACVDQIAACVGIASWPKKNSQDKFRVRCLVSSVWSDDPMYGLNLCFPPDKNIIPLGHVVFDEIALVLRHFQAWSGSNTKSWADWRKSACI
jgi:hypothetical protein